MKSLLDDIDSNRIAFVVIGLSVLIGLSPVIADQVLVQEFTSELKANATVTEGEVRNNLSLGVKVSDNLAYGEMPKNVTVRKKMNLTSNRKGVVNIESSGNISEYLNYSEIVYLEKGVNQVEIEMKAEEAGYYSGLVTMKTEIASNQIGEKWLNIKYWLYSRL